MGWADGGSLVGNVLRTLTLRGSARAVGTANEGEGV
jgi:hypothetical protein